MEIKAFIEIPSLSSIKYELDEETGELKVDRFLHTAFSYPFNYGFVKGTKGEDGDPVDVIVLSSMPVHPGVVMKCNTVGLLEMEDEEGVDTKIIAVPVAKVDPFYKDIDNIDKVNKSVLDKIKHFFENYKTLEPNKWVKVKDFKDKEAADKLITASITK